MKNRDQTIEALMDLITELEHVLSLAEDEEDMELVKEELETQSGTIKTILEG